MLSVNRGVSAFAGCLDDDIRHKCKPSKTRLTYHHTGIPAEGDELYSKVYKCVPKSHLMPLDNKKSFGAIMAHHSSVPRTFCSIEDIPDTPKTWFVKCQHAANGRQVKCMTTKQLKSYTLGPTEIIQEAITDLDLIEGCKYTIRAYLLFHNKQMYLYRDACCIKHALPYDAENTDHSVQVNHKGYNHEGSTIKLIPLSVHANYDQIIKNMLTLIKNLKPTLEPFCSYSSETTYAIWGIDILVESDFNVKLIEMNIAPNLTQMESIRKQLTHKMLNEMFRTILGMPQDGFISV